MKKLLSQIFPPIAALVLLLLAFSVMAASVTHSSTSPTQKNPVFFVQTASSAHMHNGKLELRSVNPAVVWFTDRPNRNAGHVSINRYMHLWNDQSSNFKQNNPNASLVGFVQNPVTKKRETVSVVLDLKNAKYNKQTHTLTYNMKRIKFATDASAIKGSLSMVHPTLFIDPYTGCGIFFCPHG